MTDSEINVQAYRTMAEVLISYRKIFLRGLRKVSGETWYLDACPPGVYERLVDRKENELAVERLPVEYEDLMSFATFGDLAEIFDYNEDLARLLRNLAASKDELCERLQELEWLRVKLAMACELDDQEILALTARRQELQQILTGARVRAERRAEGEEQVGPVPAPEAQAPVSPPSKQQKAVESRATLRSAERPPPVEAYVPKAEVAEEVPAAESAPAAAEAGDEITPRISLDDEPVTAEPEAVAEPLVSEEVAEPLEVSEPPAPAPSAELPETEVVVDEMPLEEEPAERLEAESAVPAAEDLDDAAADEVLQDIPEGDAGQPAAAALITVDPEVLARDMKQALSAEDDQEVLRLLRREIIAVAESVYRVDEEIDTRAWDLAEGSGWVGERTEELGLGALADFHDLMGEYRKARDSGSSRDELREFLSTQDFPRLLLTLREVFLRNGV